MKFTATVATDEPDLDGDRFENLERLARGSEGKLLLGTFGGVQVGVIDRAHVEGEHVAISGHLEGDVGAIILAMSPMYVVPGGILHKSHREGDVTVFDDFEIREFSLTTTPADSRLEPIRFVKEE